MQQKIRLVTYNIRKGKGASGRQRGCVQSIGEALAPLRPNLVLCQEVFHSDISQSARLGEALGLTPHYGPNRRRRSSECGNTILSGFPAEEVKNHNVSTNIIERRGVLYARLQLGDRPLHVFNVHLGLNQPQRLRQIKRIAALVAHHCPLDEPVLIAGDFNDWTRRVDREVTETMGFTNALAHLEGKAALTWHVRRPVFNLDRVYVRNLKVEHADVLGGGAWKHLSDHFPLLAELSYLEGRDNAGAHNELSTLAASRRLGPNVRLN